MLKPDRWPDALRLTWTKRQYPVYLPPNMKNEIALPMGEARVNFEFFEQNLPIRMAAFRSFMRRFHVDATTGDQGLDAASKWFSRYGGLLLYHKARSSITLRAFVDYDPPWIGKHIGINVVWDFGIYVGECIIARRPSAHWGLNTGRPDPSSLSALGFHRPQVEGLYWPKECDPITHVFLIAQMMCRRVRFEPAPPLESHSLNDLVVHWSSAAASNPIADGTQ